MLDLPKVVDGIRKSGFVLEYQVTELLRAHKWTVISHKYYIDDVQESAREIDLVAYKIYRHADYVMYTTLIVSCKKSDNNAWAFLMRDREVPDPNIDWNPVKVWSNETVLRHILSRDWREGYLRDIATVPILEELFTPSGHLFAFQEIDKMRATVQNDKNIFNATSSLMKAEAYELNRLEKRKKRPVIYTFNLLSIAETDLVILHFAGKDINAMEAGDARFIFNYIVNRSETASRIHFIGFGELDRVLGTYDLLHEANGAFFEKRHSAFYATVFANFEDYMLLRD